MRAGRRRGLRYLVVFAVLACHTHCTTRVEQISLAPPEVATAERPVDDGPPAPRESPSPAVTPARAGTETPAPTFEGQDSSPVFSIAYRFQPQTTTYYTIENEIRDSGGVPGLLTYTTSVQDKRSIIQRVLDEPAGETDAAVADPRARLSWECDRYQIRERGMEGETTFDSLRDSYPPAALRGLGRIPGSRSTFSINLRTGEVHQVRITPGKVGGPASRKKLSGTARKCDLTTQNLEKLLFDMGPHFLPEAPVHVGGQWTKTHREQGATFGTVVTELTCTLRDVRETEGRQIATIDLVGRVRLDRSTPTSRPARSRQKNVKKREFKVDKAICAGTVLFDLTRGRLVEMTLRRELECSAKLEPTKSGFALATEIRSGMSHVLRVKASDTPAPKPVIVGGPKPPPGEPEPAATLLAKPEQHRTTTQRARPREGRSRRTVGDARTSKSGRTTKRPAPNRAGASPSVKLPGGSKKVRPRGARAVTEDQAGVRRPPPRRLRPTSRPMGRQVRPNARSGAVSNSRRPVLGASGRHRTRVSKKPPATSQPSGHRLPRDPT